MSWGVDAGPVRAHVRELLAAGLSWRTIADNAGLSRNTVQNLVDGPRTGRPPARIRAATAQRLLAVSAAEVVGQGWVDAGPVWRQVDWLTENGWTLRGIAWETGRTPNNLTGRHCRHRRCTADFARQIAELVEATKPRRRPPKVSIHPLDRWLADRGLVTIKARARAVAVDHAQYHRWLRDGVSEPVADRLACTAGIHPALLWPDMYATAAA